MQLEYIFNLRKHERYKQTCAIIRYSPLPGNDGVTVIFADGATLETRRIFLRSKDTTHRRKRKRKFIKLPHPEYDVQINFQSYMYNKQKLKRYLKENNITANDLFNTFISNL